MAQFKNLKDLMNKFSDEQACRDYLVQRRWSGTPICPYCGCNRSYRIEDGKRFKCANKECHKKYSVTVGTVAQDTNIPLSTWFAAIYLISAHKKGISSAQLSRDLGIAQKTAWFLLHRIREALRDKKGFLLGNEVEADETYIGGRDSNRHESKKRGGKGITDDKVPVIGLLEKGGNVVTKVAPWVTKKVATDMIEKHVKMPAVLVTDSNPIYHKVGKRFEHVIVNHTIKEYVKNGHSINGLENYWSLVKRGIVGIYHQVSPDHLPAYLDEFSYRFNSRKIKDNERFELTLSNLDGFMPYKKLVSRKLDINGSGKETEITTEG